MLYELPYPKIVIIETIKIGCNNMKECVAYSNFLCEWIKRKREQMKNTREDEYFYYITEIDGSIKAVLKQHKMFVINISECNIVDFDTKFSSSK